MPPRLRRLRDFLSQLLKLAADARVEHHVADPQNQPAEDVGVDLRAEVNRTLRLALDLGANVLDDLVVELDRAHEMNVQAPILLRPALVEVAPDVRQGRHPVLLREQLEEVHQLLLRSGDGSRQPLALLRRGEVGAEEEDLEVVALAHGIGELAELLVDAIELPGLLGDVKERVAVYAAELLQATTPSPQAPRSRPRQARPRRAFDGRSRRVTCG